MPRVSRPGAPRPAEPPTSLALNLRCENHPRNARTSATRNRRAHHAPAHPHRARLLPAWRLAALLLAALAALCANPAQAQTDPVWSATLTVGEAPGSNGARGYCLDAGTKWCGYGSITDDGFTVDMTDYTVESLRWGSEHLHFTLDADFPETSLADLTLQVNSQDLPFSDEGLSLFGPGAANDYFWQGYDDVDGSGTITGAESLSAWLTTLQGLAANAEITVKLFQEGTTPILSTDATLNALALQDASDNSAITLSPSTFVSTTTSYTASEANDVDEITVLPTVNESNATYEIQNSGGTALTDADSNKTGFQVDLAVGANTVKVEVTAQDTTTTETYQVTVTREAASTDPVWSTTMTIGGGVGRGFSSVGVGTGSVVVDAFSYNGIPGYEVQIVLAHAGGVTFRTRSGNASFTNLVLEWANETLPLSSADATGTNIFTWDQAWLDANASSLNAATFAATLPEDGTGTVCLRTTAVQVCPSTTVTGSVSNSAPVFADAGATREFNETIGSTEVATASNIGAVVTATDTDNDTLAYTLEGADADKFEIVSSSGQITTKANERYDYEARASYSVTVKADDNRGGTDTIAVTLDVTDQVETPLAPAPPSVTPTAGTMDSLDVNWASPDNTGRPAVSSYDLRYKLQGSNPWVNGPQNVSDTNATIGGLSAGTEYAVQVRATNDDGDGEWSAGAKDFTLATIPQVSIAPASATEGSAVMFTVTLSATTTADVTVPYSTSVESDDTATLSSSAPGGADFVNVDSAAITIQAGSTTGTIPISTTSDTVDESNETFTVTLGTPTNATSGTTTAAKGTITDNDATPAATLVLSPTSIAEDGGSSTVTATLDRASSEATTLTVSAMAVSPAVAGDFTLSGSTLTIAAGSTASTGTVTMTANDNNVSGGNKSVTVSATAANDLAVTAPSNQTLTITDDDGASNQVALTVSPASVSENAVGSARTVTVTATLNGSALASDAVVTVSVDEDTATEDDDFTAVEDFTVTITGGSTSGSATFDLIPNNDTTDERDETVKVTGSVSGLTVTPSSGVFVTIVDDDDAPRVTLALSQSSISEAGGSSMVTATLDHASSDATTIEVSAPAADDVFTLSSNRTLTIAAGQTTSTGTVTITAVNDTTYTGDGSVTVSGTAANDLGVVQPTAVTLTIEEDDTESTTVTLAVSPASVSEGASGNARNVTVTATLDEAARPDADAVAVAVTVAGDTADEGDDFGMVPPFTVTIPGGSTSATGTFTLALQDDGTDEPDETVTVSATTTSGLTVLPSGGVAVTITDNDATPEVTLVLDPASMTENGSVSTVTATLDRPSAEETTVTVSAAAGSNTDTGDFTPSGSTLTITAGETTSTGTVTITANNNALSDGDKSVTVSATAANDLGVTAPSAQTLTITDDEGATTELTLTVSPSSVAEDATGNAQRVTVTATLGGAALPEDKAVTVSVAGGTAVEDVDFGQVSDVTLTISSGSTAGTATFTLAPVNDTTDEPNETVVVTGSVSGLTVLPVGGVQVTIVDNDATPQVTLVLDPVSIPEDGGSSTVSTVTATLDHPSAEDTMVTVSTTPDAASGADADDFTQSGTMLTIAAESTTSTGVVTIAARDNDIDHPNREVTVTGSAQNDLAIESPDAVTLTITDEESTSTQVTLTVSPSSVSEGATGNARMVTVTGTLDAAARESDATVTVSVAGGTADAGDFTAVADFVLTIVAGDTDGTATFELIPVNDTTDEPDETVRVSGTSATGLTVIQPLGGLTVMLTDDDDAPTVTLMLNPASIPEDGGSSTVTATLDRPSSEDTTVTVLAVPDAASGADADDFTQSGMTLTIAAESTTSTGVVTIAAHDNDIDHPDREVTVTGSAQNDLAIEQPDAETLAITDEEATSNEVTLTLSPDTVSEGASGSARQVTVTGMLDAAARESDATVTVTVAGGTAVAGDFIAVGPLTLTIEAGMTSGTLDFDLVPVNDTTDEPDETVRVRGTSATSGLTVNQPSGGLTVTLTDDDDAPTVTLVLSQTSISEDGGASTVTATLDHASSIATTITVSAAAGSDTVIGDFAVSANKVLMIAANATTSTGTVTITGEDNTFDDTAPKSVTVSGSAVNSQGITQPASVTLGINDDEATSTQVLLTVGPLTVSENASATSVTVTAALNGAARAADVAVTVSVAGGTATEVADFATVSDFTITIGAGDTSEIGTFSLAPAGDAIDERDETVTVSATTTATGLTGGSATVTITDDDAAPTVTLALGPASISEASGSSTVTATLDHPSSDETMVEILTAPVAGTDVGDFTQSGTTLTIAAESTTSTGTVTVGANDNNIFTVDKSVTVSGNAANDLGITQPGAQTLAIEEDDTESTTVTLSVSTDTVSEGATGNAQLVTVTAALDEAARPDAVEVAVTVAADTALEDDDYTGVPPFTVTIEAGATDATATFTLAPIVDDVDEPDKTVRVSGPTTVSGLTVAPAGGLEVTLADDDATPAVTLVLNPASISEDGGSGEVTATLDHPSSEATRITVSAAPVPSSGAGADDFTQSGATLTIAEGSTASTGTVTIAAHDNNVDHQHREVEVSGIADNDFAIEQPGAETLTITDNEETSEAVQLTVRASTAQGRVEEGDSAEVTVTMTLDKAAREHDTVIEVDVTGQGGGAREGEDFAQVSVFVVTIPAGDTRATETFTLTTLEDEATEGTESVRIRGTIDDTLSMLMTIDGTGELGNGVLPAAGGSVLIEDNDPDPVATLVLTPPSISENRGVSAVSARLDRATYQTILLNLVATPVSPAVDGDFDLENNPILIISAGETASTSSVTITGNDDDIVGTPKSVRVTGSSVTGGVVLPQAVTLLITDDDTASTGITLSVSPDRVAEDATGNDRVVTVSAALNGQSRSTATPVTVSVSGVTASAGTDYEAVSDFTVTISADQASGTGTFTLAPVDDETDAPHRTVRVRGTTTVSGLSVSPSGGLEVTIEDDDPSPQVMLALSSSSILESGGVSTVTATLDRTSSGPITVTVTPAPVSPAVDDDYRLSGSRLTIAAGQMTSTGTVTITAVGNETSADDKEVAVSGTATTTGPGVAQPDVVTLTITDDDFESTTVTLAVSPDVISEGATGSARTVTVSAELDRGARSVATSVTMTVTEGTAQGDDFAQVSDFVVTIPAGAKSGSATFTLTLFDDVIDEPDETVRVTGTLSAAAGLTLEPQGGLTVTIEDNEPEPKVTLVLSPESISEAGGESTVTAELDSASTAETTITVVATPVDPAMTGDFQLNGSTLRIAAGDTESTGTVTIEAVDNDTEAPNKRVTVTATTQNDFDVGDPAPRTLTITDNEFPSTTVTLSVTPDEVQEGDSSPVTVTAMLNGSARAGVTEITITVSAGTAAAASDFTAVAPFTLTIPADEKNATATFTLDTVDDDTDEPDETVRVSGRTSGLTVAPSGGVTVTIENDDPDPVVTLELDPRSISENGGVSTVTASLDRASSESTTVTVSAAARLPAVAGDYRLRGTRLTIPAGGTESTGTVTIAGVNNEVTASSKEVEVTGVAQNTQGVTQPGAETLTITDDDQPSTMVTLTVSPDTVPEGGGAARLTVTGALDGVPESSDTVVTLTVDTNPALEGAAEATLTIPMGQRNATAVLTLTPVDNRIDADDATVTVRASTTSSLRLSSTSFDVTITDDDERGVRVTPTKLTVLEGGSATYTVALGSEPMLDVTVDVSQSLTSGAASVTVDPETLTFSTVLNWDEVQTVTVSAENDDHIEVDAEIALTHTVRGGDYDSLAADSVTVTVPGFEVDEMAMAVTFMIPSSGVVTVPQGTGTPVPAGTQVTLPTDVGVATTLTLTAVEGSGLANPPRGFNAGDVAVDIELGGGELLGGNATVCLPVAEGGRGRVYRYDEGAGEWVQLEEPSGGSPEGEACGVTERFSLFAVGSAPNEAVAVAWLARFGRTVVGHVVDAVRERMAALRTPGMRGSVAGRSVAVPGRSARAGGTVGNVAGNVAWNAPGNAAGNALGNVAGNAPGNVSGNVAWNASGNAAGNVAWNAVEGAAPGHAQEEESQVLWLRVEDTAPGAWGGWEREPRGVTAHELLTGSRFTLTGESADGASVAVWGRGAHSRFSGAEDEASVDGAVSTTMLGADWASERTVAGVALSHSTGDGTWSQDGKSDEVESTMAGVHPYVGYEVSERLSVWGMAGYGEGELTMPDGTRTVRTDIDMVMSAGGVRRELRRGEGVEGLEGLEVALELDGLFLRIGADAAKGLEAVEADVSRVRFGLESTLAMEMAGGARLTPRLEFGVRGDGGAAETGMGVDIGGGVVWLDPVRGLRADVGARGLFLHEEQDYEEWGVTGGFTLEPGGGSGRGLSLSLRHSVGASATGGVDALFGRDTLSGLGAGSGAGERLEARAEYGVGVLGGELTGTPYLGFGRTGGLDDVRLGWRFETPARDALDVRFGVEATRGERAGGAEPEHGVAFRFGMRW